jgi:hypothetical protein
MRVAVWSSVLVVAWSAACSEGAPGESGTPAAPTPSPNGIAGESGAAGASGAAAGGGGVGSGAVGTGQAGAGLAGGRAAAVAGASAGAGGASAVGAGGAIAAAGSGGSSKAGTGAGSGAGGSGGAGAGAGGGSGVAGTTGAGGAGAGGGGAGGAAASGGLTPVLRIALRVHTAASQLSEAQLMPILAEVNEIWLEQAGICFEIEVTGDEANLSSGIDLRYTAGNIPGAAGANGLTAGQHEVWTIDAPNLGAAPNSVRSPTARTSAHELGHVLNLDHQNPPPSTDCARPCHCAVMNANCDDFLMRSGRAGFHISPDEVAIARRRAMQLALADRVPARCAAPRFMR